MGNQFWVHDTEGAAKRARQVLEDWEGTCVSRVYIGRWKVSPREIADWDSITAEGHFVKLLDRPEPDFPAKDCQRGLD